jgi:hypothetical protein
VTEQAEQELARRDYLLSEFRCILTRVKLIQLDIEATALALKFGMITAEQAVALFWDSEATSFLGIGVGSQEAGS